jgi:hypothetical protein
MMISRTAPALVALILLGIATPAAAAPPSAEPPGRITVTGSGSVDRAPDQVSLTFEVESNNDNATQATSALSSVYNALAAKLQALGVDPAAIKTTYFHINYNARPPQPNPQSPMRYGFLVTRDIAVTARTEQAGAIIDAGIAAGATSVSNVSFSLRDNRAAYQSALSGAYADADAQAHAIAAAAHLRILRVLSIDNGPSPDRPVTTVGYATKPQHVPTGIEPSALTVSATVTVSYAVAP